MVAKSVKKIPNNQSQTSRIWCDLPRRCKHRNCWEDGAVESMVSGGFLPSSEWSCFSLLSASLQFWYFNALGELYKYTQATRKSKSCEWVGLVGNREVHRQPHQWNELNRGTCDFYNKITQATWWAWGLVSDHFSCLDQSRNEIKTFLKPFNWPLFFPFSWAFLDNWTQLLELGLFSACRAKTGTNLLRY